MALSFLTALGIVFFFVFMPGRIEISPGGAALLGGNPSSSLSVVPPPEFMPTSTGQIIKGGNPGTQDIERQPQLPAPPEVVRGIYLTGWSAGSESKLNSIIELIGRTELNAVVIDIKDYSGYMSYRTGIKIVGDSGAENEPRILRPNAMIKKLHDAGIYVIARQTVFQDPILAKAYPEWAMQNVSTASTSPVKSISDHGASPAQAAELWKDNKGLPWMDPAAKPVWDYNIAIAKDAFARGFDEVNFDYIRFASDGDLNKIKYPFWDEVTPKHKIMRNFFKYLRENLEGEKISADIFGLATVDTWDDLGIGQVIEDAYEYFDYICPMVYPSHYAKGFMGYQSPAEYPYEIIKYSMDKALARLSVKEKVVISSTTVGTTTIEQTADVPKFTAKLRPWLQDFDLGATYDETKVRAQIRATTDSLSAGGARGEFYGGWLLWDPANRYTEAALGE